MTVLPLPLALHAETQAEAEAQALAWAAVPKCTPAAARLADGHYSRRTVGSPQFMPPGQTLVLLTPDERAVFGWWRPHPASGIRAMNGLDGWTCTIFRNTGPHLSSALILAAEAELLTRYDCGPDGLITYVWDRKVRSVNPGYCFKVAGWRITGRSADGHKTRLQKSVEAHVTDAHRTLGTARWTVTLAVRWVDEPQQAELGLL